MVGLSPSSRPGCTGRFRLPISLILLCLVLMERPALGQLATMEAEDVRLVYVNGTESYLVPHAARTFLNSLAFQKKLFDFTPSEDITVLLLDLEDAGNASATVVPRNTVTVQIAPLSFAFETLAGNDRMNIIMNHELVHVAAMDQAARSDRRFRRLFGGKVAPVGDQPESILYFFLTTPRVAAPRWYHEGIATFVDTWMAGGLGRGQERLRRNGLPRDGEGRRALLRSARPGVGRHEDRLPA